MAADQRQMPRCAVTTTLKLPRGAGSVLDSFVSFHLAAGFDLVFLYFDGADDADTNGWYSHATETYPPSRVVPVLAGARAHRDEARARCSLHAAFAPVRRSNGEIVILTSLHKNKSTDDRHP